MKISNRTILKASAILIILILICSIPISVYVGGYVLFRVKDENGHPLKGVVIDRLYKYDLYDTFFGKSEFRRQKLITNKDGHASGDFILIKRSLFNFLLQNLAYQLFDSCDCCLPEIWFSIDKTSLMTDDKYEVFIDYNTKSYITDCTVYMHKINKDWSFNKDDINRINKDELRKSASTMLHLKGLPFIPQALYGEFSKFDPQYICVQGNILLIQGRKDAGLYYCSDVSALKKRHSFMTISETGIECLYSFIKNTDSDSNK